MGTEVTEDLVVAEGEVRSYTQNSDFGTASALLFATWGPNQTQPSLINYGEMRLLDSNEFAQTLISYYPASFWDEAEIRNYGTISAAKPTAQYVTAIHAGSWSPDLYNSGTIVVQAQLQAIGYESWDSNLTIRNAATGSIRATAQENAFALYLANGATITNEGEMNAFKGKLRGKWVMTDTAQGAEPHFAGDACRFDDSQLAGMTRTPAVVNSWFSRTAASNTALF